MCDPANQPNRVLLPARILANAATAQSGTVIGKLWTTTLGGEGSYARFVALNEVD
jgi:hypothetical protein